jgi:PAS domain S-box-containing protein
MKINILDLIDFTKVDTLLEGFNKSTGFVTAILDLEGNVLSKSGWRQICTDFHRINTDSSKQCTISDTQLAGKMGEGEKYHFYKCLNGLIDVAVPIVINGKHIANLFSGQFFFEEPDHDYFREQATKFGFDEVKYLETLTKIPVVSKEKVLDAMDFLLNMTQMISEMTFQKLEQVELNKNLRDSDNRFTKAFRSSPVAMAITNQKSVKFIEVNDTWCNTFGFSSEEVIGRTPMELGICDSITQNQIIEQYKNQNSVKNLNLVLKNKTGHLLNFLVSIESIEVGGEICDIRTLIDITDRMQVEEKFKSVFETANVGKSITQLTGEINVNQTFCDLLGYSQEEMRNKKWQDITPKEDIPVVENHLHPLLNGEKNSTRFEKRYFCKNGTLIWADVSVSLRRDFRGEPLHFITTIIDITQRKQMEKALRESNEKLKKVLETETVGIMFWDLTTGLMMDANDTFLNMMGYGLENIEAKELTWQKLTPPEYHEISLEEIKKFQITGRVGPYEKEYICKDGTRKWLVFAGSALEGNTCVEFCVDISDRKKSESALRLERDFSKAVIDSLPGVFYCYDENLKFERWNKNFEIVTGYCSDEIVQMSPLDFYTGAERDLLTERIQEVFDKGSAEVEANFVAKDRTSTPYYFTGVTTIIDGRKHLVGVGIDVSNRKRSEKALQESELRFATLFEKAAYAVTLSSLPDGVILNANDAFERIFGFSKVETIGRTALDLGINPDFEDRQRLYTDLQKYGYVRNLELELHIKSGEKRLFSINSDLIEIGSDKFFLNTIDDITERKRAEDKQTQTYELLTNLARLVPGVIYQYRLYPDGRSAFPYSSPGMYSIYEVTPEQVREDATPVFGRLHPDDADRVSNLIFESARTLEEFYCEFRVILPEQGLRWRWSQAHPERTEDGGTLWHGIISDISERKQAENALRESERHLRTSQKIAHLGSWQMDLATNQVIWTEELYNMYGFDPALPPPPYTEHKKLFTPASWERLSASLTNTRETGIPYVLELETVKKDGSNGWMWVRGEVTKDSDGKTIGLWGAAQDITERRQAEEERKKFVMLAESSSEFIGMCDLELNPIYVNPAGQRLVGLPDMAAACRVKVQDYFFPEDQRYIAEEFFPRVLREGHGDVEIRLRHFQSGEPIWMYYYLFRVHDARGTLVGWATVSRDITERKRMLEELEQLNADLEWKVLMRTAQLEASNKELEAFSYSVSHDLRAPLRHISGYVDLLNKKFRESLPEKAGHYLNEITDSAKQMGDLIDDLLQFSRTGRQELRQANMDMNAVVQQVLAELNTDTENRKISWTVAELPWVIGDYSLLKQVWVNLLDNAVKYTRYKDGAEIEVGFNREPDQWVFFVRDNGIGFDMQYAHKLFGVFQRMHSPAEYEGTGIGLANVQAIVHKHGGRVWADAQPDKGATFYFTLPCDTIDEEANHV